MSSKLWDKITCPFPNFNSCTVEVWGWISNFITHFCNGCNHLSMLRLKLIHVSKGQDDVIKWQHFPRYWPFVQGIHRSPVNSPHKGQWRGALMFSLICAWINGCVNNREAGDLRRYRAHYDVIVMRPCSHSIVRHWFQVHWVDIVVQRKMYSPTSHILIRYTYSSMWSMRQKFTTTFYVYSFGQNQYVNIYFIQCQLFRNSRLCKTAKSALQLHWLVFRNAIGLTDTCITFRGSLLHIYVTKPLINDTKDDLFCFVFKSINCNCYIILMYYISTMSNLS